MSAFKVALLLPGSGITRFLYKRNQLFHTSPVDIPHAAGGGGGGEGGGAGGPRVWKKQGSGTPPGWGGGGEGRMGAGRLLPGFEITRFLLRAPAVSHVDISCQASPEDLSSVHAQGGWALLVLHCS